MNNQYQTNNKSTSKPTRTTDSHQLHKGSQEKQKSTKKINFLETFQFNIQISKRKIEIKIADYSEKGLW